VDKEFASAVAGELKNRGFRIFYAPWSITGFFQAVIEKALGESDAGLIVLSPDAVNSNEVRKEASVLFDRAKHEGKPLVPVLYRDSEIPPQLKKLQYVDFRDPAPEARTLAFDDLAKALQGIPPGGSVWLGLSRSTFRRRFVTLCAIVSFILLLTIKSGITYVYFQRTLDGLKQTQAAVQQIEEGLGSQATELALRDGDREYRDPVTGIVAAKDEWSAGHLVRRNFYRNDHLIARDEFTYSNDIPREKRRLYLDAEQRIFLEDEFTQDGNLVSKRYCAQGKESGCERRVVEMMSPLPPIWVMVYR
jgi:hypothetical protein